MIDCCPRSGHERAMRITDLIWGAVVFNEMARGTGENQDDGLAALGNAFADFCPWAGRGLGFSW